MNWLDKYQDGGLIENETVTPIKKTQEEPIVEIPLGARNLIRKYDVSQRTQQKYQNIHTNSNSSCLAGGMNCFTQSQKNPEFGFVSKNLPGLPSMRSYLNKGDTSKYLINDNEEEKFTVGNKSIDAWEIHDYLRGENLGKELYADTNFTYKNNEFVPDQILENPQALPVGTIIGQGQAQGTYIGSDVKGNKNRHAITVIGYDEKDGMPIVYDYGFERRLDDPRFRYDARTGEPKRMTNFTVPNEYANLTYDNIKNRTKEQIKDLGYSNIEEENNISLESSWEPIQAIEKGVNTHSKRIASHYNVKKSVIDKFSKLLPGLSNKETKLNNNDGTSDTIISDNWLSNNILKPVIKSGKNLFIKDSTESTKQDWEIEIEAYKKYPKNTEKRKKYYKELRDKYPKTKAKERVESSVGAFKIKDLPTYFSKIGKDKSDLYGITVSNEKELELGSAAALSLLSEKYLEAKKIHKDKNLTEDQLIKLAVIGYSNSSKLKSDEFVDYYIKQGTGLKDNNFEKISKYTYNKPRNKKTKETIASNMKNGGWLSKYENGGIIEDDRGQWAHPGQVTRINSNDITMKGVNFPVLGISDTGDQKLMLPGQDYKFKGKSVTEYPIKAQKGKTISKGWLDKYNK